MADDVPLRKFDSDGYEIDPKWLADLIYKRMEVAEAKLEAIRELAKQTFEYRTSQYDGFADKVFAILDSA